ncbi:lysylphosphatidylglycerol synthase transmembrane domain-containing protein [Luteibacter sp.]|uniref:lysylphosphatidylglycerol synthase transmembrane domain-containing protein n=1 Tax=Luteibacter sp. TaxID=1886636 RepID=UPI002D807126|nr:lysylphosphatidylglycerol synthase transmembrane domain-containing protein [Luteibacter sp.]
MLDEPVPLTAPTKGKNGIVRLIIGCALSAVCLYFVFRNIRFEEVGRALATFHWPYLIVGVLSLAVGYTARIFRWKLLLEACGPKVTTVACASPFLASIALNNVLPFRLGDVVRALVFPAALGVTKTGATATLVLERLVDLLTLLMCLAVAASFFPKGALPASVVDIVIVLSVIGSVALLGLILFTGLIVRFVRWFARRIEPKAPTKVVVVVRAIADLVEALQSISRMRTVFAALAISFVAWAGELGLYLALMQGIGMAFSLPGGLLLMSMATIATLVPSSPGYVGPYHLAAFTAAHLMGGSSTQAMTLAVLCHLGVWLPTTIAGATVMIFNRNLFNAARNQASLEAPGDIT